MDDKTNHSRTNAGPEVPLGIVAFGLGSLALLVHVAGRVGLLHEAPAFLFPIGVALFLTGYIACFALRRIYKRIEALEHRVDALTKGKAQETKASDHS